MSKFWGAVQKILNMAVTPIDAFLAFFEWFIILMKNLAMKLVLFILENKSLKVHLIYRENRRSKSCFVLDLSSGV